MIPDRLFYLLNKYKISPSKSFSQNFLISDEVLRFMASYGKGKVLEIGPVWDFSQKNYLRYVTKSLL